MKIKRINLRFLKSMYKLGHEQFGKDYWFTKEFLRETLKGKGVYLGAFEKDKLVGTMLVDIGIDRPKAWIFFFDVKKEYREHGIGTKLLERVEAILPKDYYKLFVDCNSTDKSGLRFYKEHGFKRVAKIKDWFGFGTKGIILSKTVKKY